MSARSIGPSRDARMDRSRFGNGFFNSTERQSRPSAPARVAKIFAVLVLGLFAAAVALVGAPSSTSYAQEPNSLKSTVPETGSTLHEMPTKMVFTFTQPVRGGQTLDVKLACGIEIPMGDPEYSSDRLTVTVPIASQVPRGACVSNWTLKNKDGSTLLNGSLLTFNVEADPPVSSSTTVAAAAAVTTTVAPVPGASVPPNGAAPATTPNKGSGNSGGTIWFGRLLSMVGIMALFGGISMIAIGWREGPEYVLTARYLRAVWVVAILGAFITMVAVAADATGSSFGGGIYPGTWWEAAGTWSGRSALMALVLVIASASVAYAPERVTDPATAPWAWGLPALSLTALALIRVTGPVAPIGFLLNLVHLFTAAICFGGAALVFRAVLAGAGGDDLVVATRTFSRVAIPALMITVATGVLQMFRLDGTALFSNAHGRVVLLKILLVGGLAVLIFGVRNQVALRLDHSHEISEATAARLRRPIFAEAGLGVVILALSAWMLALTPPAADPLRNAKYTVTIPIEEATTGLKATAYIGPAKVGKNGFKLAVDAPPSGITSLVVTFTPPVNSGVEAIEQVIPLAGAGTAYRLQSDGFPFDAAGQWKLEIAIATATVATPASVTYAFEVAPATGTAAPAATTPPAGTPTVTTVAGAAAVTTLAPVPGAPTTTVPPNISVVEVSTTTAPFASN